MVAEHIDREVFFAMFPRGTRLLWWDDESQQPGKVVGREEMEDKTTIFFRLDTDDGRTRRRCEWQQRSRIVLEPSVPQGEVGAEAIVQAVASHFGLTPSDLTGRGRDETRVQARWIAVYLIRQHTDLTQDQTGAALGGRHSPSICYAYGRIASEIEQEHWLRREVEGIRRTLRK